MMIITNLRNNARESLTAISKRTRIPVSTIFDKLKERVNGVIKKPTILLDFQKLGYSTVSMLLLKVNKEHKEQLRNNLSKCFNVNTIYKINNGYDFIAEVVFKNMQEQEKFIEKLEENYDITEIKTFFIVEEVKKEEFFSGTKILNYES